MKKENKKYNITFITLNKYNNIERTLLVESPDASSAADLIWRKFGGIKRINIENVEEIKPTEAIDIISDSEFKTEA